MNFEDPALTFALALFSGVLAQTIALHLRIPGIILLLGTGILLGPEVANVVRPESLGSGLQPIVGLSVAVILFEGGLQLNIDRLRREAVTIRRLVTIGALVTLTGATVTAILVLGWDWRISLLFGTLVVVTGPTVINPLMRRIRLRPNLRTILEAEGVLIDPIGAILAVVALEVILATTAQGAARGLLGLPYRLGLGFVMGIAGGLATAWILRIRSVIPLVLRNIFTLSLVLTLFQASNAILPESGIMTVAIAGLVVGNLRTPRARELAEFKEQLTSLLVGLLFVLLAAAVQLEEVLALGWPGLATVLILIAAVRPLDVLVSTWQTELDRRERSFLAWLAPRGIVAFAISSLFATELGHVGMEAEGEALRAIVFLVIAATVILQGGTGSFVAGLLGVRTPSDYGYVIVGANPIGRALALALREASGDDEPIVLIDTNPMEAHAAEAEGFRVIYGNANDERTLRKAAVESRRAFLAATPNEGVNLLLANRAHDIDRDVERLVALDAHDPGVAEEQVHESEAHVLFGFGVDHERWAHDLRQDRAEVGPWTYEGPAGTPLTALPLVVDGLIPLLPLVHRRGGVAGPVSDATDLRPGDEVWFAWLKDQSALVSRRLRESGWAEPAHGGYRPD